MTGVQTCALPICYALALEREADEDGLNEWCAHLLEKDLTPERVAFGFVFSDEAHALGLDDTAFMTMLYRLMMDREPDADGLANWLTALADAEARLGEDPGRQEIYALFAASEEFGLMIRNFGF